MMYAVKGISDGIPTTTYATALFATHSDDCVLRHKRRGKDKPMEITYTRVEDYLIPDITLSEKPPPDSVEPLGRYGQLRQRFLKEHRTIFYNTLLLTERLYPHLRDTDETAIDRKRRGVSEEIILSELVYE